MTSMTRMTQVVAGHKELMLNWTGKLASVAGIKLLELVPAMASERAPEKVQYKFIYVFIFKKKHILQTLNIFHNSYKFPQDVMPCLMPMFAQKLAGQRNVETRRSLCLL